MQELKNELRLKTFQAYNVVKTFVDKIYSSLALKEIELELTSDLANVFSILTPASNVKEEATGTGDDVDDVSIIDESALNSFDLVFKNPSSS